MGEVPMNVLLVNNLHQPVWHTRWWVVCYCHGECSGENDKSTCKPKCEVPSDRSYGSFTFQSVCTWRSASPECSSCWRLCSYSGLRLGWTRRDCKISKGVKYENKWHDQVECGGLIAKEHDRYQIKEIINWVESAENTHVLPLFLCCVELCCFILKLISNCYDIIRSVVRGGSVVLNHPKLMSNATVGLVSCAVL